MIVLGYSGLDESVAYARRNPDLRKDEDRMVQGLDSAAALVIDGEVVAAAAEERFCDEKHTNRFPRLAIDYCLEHAGIRIDAVDVVAHGFNYRRAAGLLRRFDPSLYDEVLSPALQVRLLEEQFGDSVAGRFAAVEHHRAHAASAYYPSGFDDALCLVVDGMGELESLTVYAIRGGAFEKLCQIDIANSIGILYGLATRHLGFKFNADEYKLMGLAPYGNPSAFRSFFDDLVHLKDGGTFEVRYTQLTGRPQREQGYRDVLAAFAAAVDVPADVDAMAQRHLDFAAAAQECLERALLHTVTHWQSATGLRRLCLAGGVALNCTFNGKLIGRHLFDEIYIQPAAGDDGAALGAALAESAERGHRLRRYQEMPFYGPEFTTEEILAAAGEFAGRVTWEDLGSFEAAAEDAARGVKDDLVQAWFQGRMEFGPRALGNRTILANPAAPDIKARVNSIIKLREGFRPFAPAVLMERAADYFDIDVSAAPFEYMLATCQVREEWRDRLPGITHVDGSARVQTVSRERNPSFHALIEAIGTETGVFVTMNTSFNVRSQPMIATPRTAIETFLRVAIDRLYVGTVKFTKVDQGSAAQG